MNGPAKRVVQQPLDIGAVQEALRADGLDGWLLYDFHGSNPVATSLVGLAGTGRLSTRRWYYMIPANGARAGGVILPIGRSIAEIYGSKPGATANAVTPRRPY